ncbi:hypothetical protein H7F33_17535 [Pedobacter sp. PAMC26386]|nr:hypothetical protein H7F33_17535 [Pedobacter sp. PAMC26386]
MILVLSYKKFEQGTDPVVDWLIHYNADFMRVSVDDIASVQQNYTVDIYNDDIIYKGKSLKDKVKVIWNRRVLVDFQIKAELENLSAKAQLRGEANQELRHLTEFIAESLIDKKWLPPFKSRNINKLDQLRSAKNSGLNVPRSKVLNNKADVISFNNELDGGLITKPIDFCGYYTHEADTYTIFTNELTPERMADLPNFFFPTLFQEKIEVEYEIRVFYLDGEFDSIVTVNKSLTKDVDKKLYSADSNSHQVPYNLSSLLKDQLTGLMQSLNLNIGSIDVMKSKNGRFYFLEVNPVGQYLSESCTGNFFTEKKIAEWLIKSDK